MIPLPTSVLARRTRGLVARGGGSPAPAHPLQPYYDSGTIVIHYDTDAATRDGNGAITAFQNRGAGGALFNAPVTGAAMQVAGQAVVSEQTGGYGAIATAADLIGVRTFLVLAPNQFAGSNQIMGSTSAVLRQANNAQGWRINAWMNPGTGGTTFSSTIFIENVDKFSLCEVELTSTNVSFFVNGVAGGGGAHVWPNFLADKMASGGTGSDRFKGRMGDILGVVLGRADTNAAITAARAYLNTRFALGMVL